MYIHISICRNYRIEHCGWDIPAYISAADFRSSHLRPMHRCQYQLAYCKLRTRCFQEVCAASMYRGALQSHWGPWAIRHATTQYMQLLQILQSMALERLVVFLPAAYGFPVRVQSIPFSHLQPAQLHSALFARDSLFIRTASTMLHCMTPSPILEWAASLAELKVSCFKQVQAVNLGTL